MRDLPDESMGFFPAHLAMKCDLTLGAHVSDGPLAIKGSFPFTMESLHELDVFSSSTDQRSFCFI